MAKLVTTAFVFILLCGISQLLSTKEYDEILAAAEYYKAGRQALTEVLSAVF